MKNKIYLMITAFSLIAGIFLLAIKFYNADQREKFDQVAQSNNKKFIPDYAPKMGPDNAKVKLVEFLDPECESCREFFPYMKMLMQETEGKVQLVIRYAPFHPNSKFAIKILEAARKQGKYWEVLEILFRYQPEWGSHHQPKPELIWNYLPQAGVDIEKIKQDMNDPAIDQMIENEIKDGAELGVTSTPTFFVNGKMPDKFGVSPLRQLIYKELHEAN